MNTELSTELITHKLQIRGEWVKYISKKMAENIYAQLTNKTETKIIISNPKTLTHITKYKSEVNLVELDRDSRSFEDTIYFSWLNEYQRDQVREIWEMRKKEKKSLTQGVLENIISSFKNNS